MAEASASSTSKRKPLKVDIGCLTEKNVGQLKKLNLATFPVTYQEQFYNLLWKNLEYCRLGYYADSVVSAICCRIEDRPQGGKALYIMTLSVLTPYQRRGIASQLVKWAIEKAESEERKCDEVQEIYLNVQTSNESALTFYKSFGFEITETIPNYYVRISPPDCHVLRKSLNGGIVSPPGDSERKELE
mmetsp:Transcript_80358/g.260445  ORF Transcript_80358/g.260445 Transcript_80358/m.260445 type:complete len:188 (+) Transcript_80358:107-670(+)